MTQRKGSIKSVVTKYLKSEIETKGGDNTWLLNMGYQACNDYANVACQILSSRYAEYFRFETVARNIRSYKETLRNSNQGVS